jgi:hypothetical protein
MTNNTWTNIISAVPVLPPYAQYSQINMAAPGNYDFVWPNTFADTNNSGQNVLTNWLDINPTVSSTVLVLPSVASVGIGSSVLIRNVGSQAANVNLNNNAFFLTIPVGAAFILLLQDNSTAQGTWTNTQFGTGTSAADASALEGYGLIAFDSTLNINSPVVTFNASFEVTANDRGGLLNYIGGEGTATLPPPNGANIGNGFKVSIKNSSTIGGILTIVNPAGTIDGLASLDLLPGSSAIFVSDGNVTYLSESLLIPFVFQFSDVKFVVNQESDLAPQAQSLGDLNTGLIKNTTVATLPFPTGTLSNAIAGTDYYAPTIPTTLQEDEDNSNISVGNQIVFESGNINNAMVVTNPNLTGTWQNLHFLGTNLAVDSSSKITFIGDNIEADACNNIVAIGDSFVFKNSTNCVVIGNNQPGTFNDCQDVVVIGNTNTIAEPFAGDMVIIGSNNTVGLGCAAVNILGSQVDVPNNLQNVVCVGESADVNQSDTLRLGGDNIVVIAGGKGNTAGKYTFNAMDNSNIPAGLYLQVNTTLKAPTTKGGGVLACGDLDQPIWMNSQSSKELAYLSDQPLNYSCTMPYGDTNKVIIAPGPGTTEYFQILPGTGLRNLLKETPNSSDQRIITFNLTISIEVNDASVFTGITKLSFLARFIYSDGSTDTLVDGIIPYEYELAYYKVISTTILTLTVSLNLSFLLRQIQAPASEIWGIDIENNNTAQLTIIPGSKNVSAIVYPGIIL